MNPRYILIRKYDSNRSTATNLTRNHVSMVKSGHYVIRDLELRTVYQFNGCRDMDKICLEVDLTDIRKDSIGFISDGLSLNNLIHKCNNVKTNWSYKYHNTTE